MASPAAAGPRAVAARCRACGCASREAHRLPLTVRADGSAAAKDLRPLIIDPGALQPGLVAVTGDEGAGKTRLLRRLGEGDSALWLDLSLPGCDEQVARQVWDALRQRCPLWNAQLQQELVDALGLRPHLDKQLFMLSTGSRRKVALVGLLASGAAITCLDQPFAALDAPSARVVRDFLRDVAEHATRTWVVADYEADPRLPWRHLIALG